MEGTYPEVEVGTIYHSSHFHALQLISSDHGHPQTRCCDPTATTMMNTKKKPNPVYGCRPCNFYIHKACAELLPHIRHPSHPLHTLTLVHASPYLQGASECDACCKPIDSSTGFFYHCTHCSFDLHTRCAFLPSTISHPGSHPHLLSLRFSDAFSFSTYKCDLCWKMIAAKAWLYHCVPCDFQAHTDCALGRRGGSPWDSAAPDQPMERHYAATGQPPNPLMSGLTPATWPGLVGGPDWPMDGHPSTATSQPPNPLSGLTPTSWPGLVGKPDWPMDRHPSTATSQPPNPLSGRTPAIWPGQVGAPGVSSGLYSTSSQAAAPGQGTRTKNDFEPKIMDGSPRKNRQTIAPAGQPPNPLSGITPATCPGQVGASGIPSGLDASHHQAAAPPAQGTQSFEGPKKENNSLQSHGDGVATHVGSISSQADAPLNNTSNRQQQSGGDGEVPDYVALRLEMMKLQMSINFAQTTNNMISNWGRPWY